MFWNPEVLESAIFHGMTANPVGQMQKLNHGVRATYRFIFQAKQKKGPLVESVLERELYAIVFIGTKKRTMWSLASKKSPRPLAMTLGSVLKDSGLNYVCAAARTATRCFNILNHYHIR